MSSHTFVVYRQAYSAFGATVRQGDDSYSISHVAMRAFADRTAAEQHVAELMRAARRTTNPFALYDAIGTPKVSALGVPWRSTPPDNWDDEESARWYDAEAPHLTDEQRAKVWSLFDKRPLYGIREVPLGDE